MNKQLITFLCAAVLITACGNRGISVSGELLTDSISANREDSMAQVGIRADWPVEATTPLAKSICTYISQTLGTEPADDGRTVVAQAVETAYQELKGEWMDMNGEGFTLTLLFSQEIVKGYETDKTVTYDTSTETFHGGAHGSYSHSGQTFRKSDGLCIGYVSRYDDEVGTFHIEQQTLFNDKVDTPEFKALLKEGVASYFKEMSNGDDDWTLEDMLIGVDNVNALPLPQFPPTFTKDGLAVVYQQYEIAPYAAGLPSFVIPYDAVKPFLTDDAAALIP